MKSHVGRVRQVNEDYFACTASSEGRVLAVVADGVGGHQAGEVASRMAVERILKEMRDLKADLPLEDQREKLMNALLLANDEVFHYALTHPECSGMGTTVVAALISSQEAITAHIGDSRLYHYSENGLSQWTEDHSFVQELIKRGQITQEEASVHPQRNIVMRALGTEKDILVDLGQFAWKEGDVVLLCSDGLSDKVDQSVMEKWLREPISLQAKVDAMVQHALDAGGEDNITLVAVSNTPKPIDVWQREG